VVEKKIKQSIAADHRSLAPPPMSHRRNTVHPQQHQPPRSSGVQRSYVVSIDAGAFANVEIVVGGCHRGGVWTPSRTATITAKSKSHDHASYCTPAFSLLPAMNWRSVHMTADGY
jgi:hypothetical protein